MDQVAESSLSVTPKLQLASAVDYLAVTPIGDWQLRYLSEVVIPKNLAPYKQIRALINGKNLTAIDTAGASLLLNTLRDIGIEPHRIKLEECDEKTVSILTLVDEKTDGSKRFPPRRFSIVDSIYNYQKGLLQSAYEQITFFGELMLSIGRLILNPGSFRFQELVIQMERVGISSIPIMSLVTFLIGLVVAYLFANQAAKFGANIFIVDAVGMGVCRELSPLLVSILCAGRSGSAFTAQLGTMKITEEVDAIRVLGLSPTQVLIIPRMLALVIMLPLLVLVGDFFGILGGVVIAHNTLDVTYETFFTRLQAVLAFRHIGIGLIKAPVYAFVIAFIGCRLGLAVENNSRSVGINTTKTVVQSIVAVILLNAAFAVFFQELKW